MVPVGIPFFSRSRGSVESIMTRYIIRRLLISIPVLWLITLITFVMASLMPGDYIDTLIPYDQRKNYSAEFIANLRHYYGLDEPAPIRYLLWMRELVFNGNLGYSYRTGEP